ncbi:MAG: 30S ribosomal protein S1, partial [Cyanobacteria bacterium P01_A01_bin.17]
FKVGDPIKAIVLNIDDERGRIALSTQVLEKYPGEILKEMPTMMAEAEERAKNVAKVLAQGDN